jgi:excinuclease UvrABC ATPase subunit
VRFRAPLHALINIACGLLIWGGRLMKMGKKNFCMGTPEQIVKIKASITGQYLKIIAN